MIYILSLAFQIMVTVMVAFAETVHHRSKLSLIAHTPPYIGLRNGRTKFLNSRPLHQTFGTEYLTIDCINNSSIPQSTLAILCPCQPVRQSSRDVQKFAAILLGQSAKASSLAGAFFCSVLNSFRRILSKLHKTRSCSGVQFSTAHDVCQMKGSS
jgi:hypothetical protein